VSPILGLWGFDLPMRRSFLIVLRLDSKKGLHHVWCPSMEEGNET
jgi:hypothetical protein